MNQRSWLSDVPLPDGWQAMPLKRVAKILNGGTPGTDEANWNGTIPFVTPLDLNGVDGGVLKHTQRSLTAAGAESSTIAPRGSIFVSTRAPIGYVGRIEEEAAFNQGCRALVLADDQDARYWSYVMQAARSEMQARGQGTTFLELSGTSFGVLPVPVAPLPEQKRIADYLDHEIAEIQTLIAAQKRFVELLDERWTAQLESVFIDVPKCRLKHVISVERPLTYGIVQAGEPVAEGVPYIGPSDILSPEGVGDTEALRKTTHEIAASYQRSSLSTGDVIVSIGPAYGKTMIVPDTLVGANLTQDTARVTCDIGKAHNRYIQWVLRSPAVLRFWDQQITGATFRRLNLDTLANTPISIPSLDEQRRIAAYLDLESAKNKHLIEISQRHMELAKERQATLISAAVTAQIDIKET